MIHTIQDQPFKRSLDYLGLRGVVPHDYESTVLPTLSVGNMGQQTTFERPVNFNPTLDLWLVPQGETWRPYVLTGILTQAAGVTAARWILQFLTGGGALFAIMHLPAFFSQAATFSAGPVLGFTAPLNTSTNFHLIFPPGLLMPSGSRIQISATPGDGTLSIDQQAMLVYNRLGERLVDVR